jgi:hypothetical protein
VNFSATCHNQYGAEIGSGYGDTSEAAVSMARRNARETLARANPNWKWRVAKVKVHEWEGRLA